MTGLLPFTNNTKELQVKNNTSYILNTNYLSPGLEGYLHKAIIYLKKNSTTYFEGKKKFNSIKQTPNFDIP